MAKAAFCLTAAFILLFAQPAAAQTVTISSPSVKEGDISGRTLQFTVTVNSYAQQLGKVQGQGRDGDRGG